MKLLYDYHRYIHIQGGEGLKRFSAACEPAVDTVMKELKSGFHVDCIAPDVIIAYKNHTKRLLRYAKFIHTLGNEQQFQKYQRQLQKYLYHHALIILEADKKNFDFEAASHRERMLLMLAPTELIEMTKSLMNERRKEHWDLYKEKAAEVKAALESTRFDYRFHKSARRFDMAAFQYIQTKYQYDNASMKTVETIYQKLLKTGSSDLQTLELEPHERNLTGQQKSRNQIAPLLNLNAFIHLQEKTLQKVKGLKYRETLNKSIHEKLHQLKIKEFKSLPVFHKPIDQKPVWKKVSC